MFWDANVSCAHIWEMITAKCWRTAESVFRLTWVTLNKSLCLCTSVSDLEPRFLAWDPQRGFRRAQMSLALYAELCLFMHFYGLSLHRFHQILKQIWAPKESRETGPNANEDFYLGLTACLSKNFSPTCSCKRYRSTFCKTREGPSQLRTLNPGRVRLGARCQELADDWLWKPTRDPVRWVIRVTDDFLLRF